MIQGVLDKHHCVYLHCFMASMDEYFITVRAFPKSVFGITLMTLQHLVGEDIHQMELGRRILEVAGAS